MINNKKIPHAFFHYFSPSICDMYLNKGFELSDATDATYRSSKSENVLSSSCLLIVADLVIMLTQENSETVSSWA